MNKKAIILDTSSFCSKTCDFAGISNGSIIKLNSSIKQCNIDLLIHPVLRAEINRHITIIWKEKIANAEKALCENNLIYSIAGINTESASESIHLSNILEKELMAFSEFYKNAIILPYPSPDKVFRKYFSSKPPFAETGKKKDEFPDAFVLESLLDFVEQHNEYSIIAVSKDPDWEKTLNSNPRVELVKDISDVLRLINGSEEFAISLLESNEDLIIESITDNVNNVYFTVYDYNVLDLMDFSSVDVSSIDNVVVLDAHDTTVQIQFTAGLVVEGEFTFFDSDNSVWDSENKDYIFTSFSTLNFKNGKTNIQCEISFDISDSSKPQIKSFHILTEKNYEIVLDDEQIEIKSMDFDVDIEAEQMDAIEEFYKH